MFSPEKFEPRFEPKPEEAQEKERKEIGLIEKSSLLDYQDKETLLLAYLKEKPTAWLTAESQFYKTEPKEKQEKILDQLAQRKKEIEELLEKLGMTSYFKFFKTEEEKTIKTGYDFLAGQDLEKLNHLKEGVEKGNHKEIGLALGYPETAVEGFINGNYLHRGNIREFLSKALSKKALQELQREGVLKFLTFSPSKEHWQEELEAVGEHQMLIKEKSPHIYQEIMRKAPDPLTAQGRLKTKFEGVLNRLEYYKRGL